MPKKIPIKTAKDVAEKHKCKQVIIMAWDGKLTHCVTYGETVEDCDQAAKGGNRIKAALGWPESLMSESSSVKKLKKENEILRKENAQLERQIDNIRNASYLGGAGAL